MSAYTNINTSGLLSAINSAISELNTNDLNSVKRSINSIDIMQSSAKAVFITNLDMIINSNKIGSISVLKNNLSKLKDAVNKIKSYQQLEKEVKELEKRRWKDVPHTETVTDSAGGTHTTTRYETVEDSYVVSQINSKKASMASYDNQIKNLLS